MKEKKNDFLKWLGRNYKTHDEYTIGATLGLSHKETDQLLIQLLNEKEIIKEPNGLCKHKIAKVQ